ncbi:hypothetical protein SAMN05660690_0025 [Geodermatophilus telluris]|uniref:Uncharacterized protein n=1 Tax=Geodermatophilus telluris TaxID=1190417 RepID=A0A1G6HUE7_9ACTN|nr:hypothetical protein [Geodermatophilus telluris]SDB97862.1 hypothetical protein SAMN05660690_0025 [Geodermatophilus telluris]
MSENDPDPYLPAEGQGRSELGGRVEPNAGDPTDGGREGRIGEAPSIAADEPGDGGPALPPGGGRVAEDTDAAPVADPGPDA